LRIKRCRNGKEADKKIQFKRFEEENHKRSYDECGQIIEK